LVEGTLPEAGEAASPWFIRVMLGFAGWLGALFLLGFVGAAFAFVFKSASAALFMGACACAAAIAIFRAAPKSGFLAPVRACRELRRAGAEPVRPGRRVQELQSHAVCLLLHAARSGALRARAELSTPRPERAWRLACRGLAARGHGVLRVRAGRDHRRLS